MATLLVPAGMRPITGGRDRLEVRGATLGECIADAERQHPGVRERLVDEEGEIQPHIAIYVAGEDARAMQDLNTPVGPGDEIMVVPAVGGGASPA